MIGRPRLARVVELHHDRQVLLVIALAAAWGFVVLADLVGSMSYLGLLLVLLASLLIIGDSDGIAGALLLGALVWQWISSRPPADTWWSLPAAWLLLLAFAAVALLAAGPDGAAVPREQLVSWLRRVGAVAAVTALVAVVGLTATPLAGPLLSYAAVLALVALAVAGVLALRRRDP
ncbi:hypothetical protein [Flexivirga meconopsidis]|uniref:hypothetical protein n=1 Tax=Flexivirga meconopsidis TaxID=2977121 RepID=UPI00223ED591|nr:hypothetical protein [Flexivirga meconopsidis]